MAVKTRGRQLLGSAAPWLACWCVARARRTWMAFMWPRGVVMRQSSLRMIGAACCPGSLTRAACASFIESLGIGGLRWCERLPT